MKENGTNLPEEQEKAGVPAFRTATLLEPAFVLPEHKSLRLDLRKWGDRGADYLARRIARTPLDLRAHIQRLNLHLGKRESSAAYGALLDLFITLGDKGISLRRRMLQRAQALLSEEQYQALSSGLESGITATDPLPPSAHSVLSKGLTGISQLVVRVEQAPEAKPRDPLEEAIEYLEYSQVDKAREVLERAVLADPDRLDLQSNLLAIYRASGDNKHFLAFRDKLCELDIPVSDEWRRLAEHFST